MARDDFLLQAEHYHPAALRLYQWDPPTISLGYFQSIASLQELPEPLQSLAVVRRQTGGGAILHDREITYCLVVADELPIARQAPEKLYRLVHELWREILANDYPQVETAPDSAPMPSPRSGPFFCFQRPGRTDLVLSGAKLLGSAQRRVAPTAHSGASVLQHGSLMLGQRFTGHPGASLDEPDPQRIDQWLGEFIDRLAQSLELEVAQANWSAADRPEIEQRRQRFASSGWTARR